jgi:hypothetical protein
MVAWKNAAVVLMAIPLFLGGTVGFLFTFELWSLAAAVTGFGLLYYTSQRSEWSVNIAGDRTGSLYQSGGKI